MGDDTKLSLYYAYDGESKLTGVTDENSSQVVGYSYDMDGNLSGRTVPGNNMTATYAYDYQNRLTSLANQTGAGVISQYTSEYLANGQKSEETSEAVDEEGKKSKKTTFVWDGDQMVMELDASGKVQRRYIRGNDRGYGSNLVYADKGNGTEKQYYVTDPHGSVVQLTDEKGKVIKIYEYDSFGNEVNPDSKEENPFRYCGEYYDKEMEEIYLRARYYEPNVGRFLTRDSYTGEDDEPLSLHLYTYCENDGVNSVDPSGHKTYKQVTKDEVYGMTKKVFKYRLKVIKEVREKAKKMGEKTYTSSSIKTSNVTNVLARAIYMEAGGKEEYTEKQNRNEIIMLYKVICNRKDSKGFPNTIKEVITAPGQINAIYSRDALNEIPAMYNDNFSNVRWIRSVVISVLNKKKYKTGIKYPSGYKDYLFWHSNDDWMRKETKKYSKEPSYTLPSGVSGKKKNQIRFIDSKRADGTYKMTKYKTIKRKKQYGYTWFYTY